MPGNPQIEARLYCVLNSCGGVYGVWENHWVKGGGREKAAFSGDFGGLPHRRFHLKGAVSGCAREQMVF
jgi:hypothetical protein